MEQTDWIRQGFDAAQARFPHGDGDHASPIQFARLGRARGQEAPSRARRDRGFGRQGRSASSSAMAHHLAGHSPGQHAAVTTRPQFAIAPAE